jgi:hypothetical protein
MCVDAVTLDLGTGRAAASAGAAPRAAGKPTTRKTVSAGRDGGGSRGDTR